MKTAPEFLLGGWTFSGYYTNNKHTTYPHVFLYLSPKFPGHFLMLDGSGYYKVMNLKPVSQSNNFLALGNVDFLLLE